MNYQLYNNYAKTDWYADVLEGKISYRKVLLNNRQLIRKQRIKMFINHMISGKIPLLAYYYFNNNSAKTYFLLKREEIVKNYDNFCVRNQLKGYYNLDGGKQPKDYYRFCKENQSNNNKIVSTQYPAPIPCPDNISEQEQYELNQDRLHYLYYRYGGKYSEDYLYQGAEMLGQLVKGNQFDAYNLSLEDLIYCTLEIVKEYCSFTKHTDVGAILTIIFTRGFFLDSTIPSKKKALFTSNVYGCTYTSFTKLPTVYELIDCIGDDLFDYAPTLLEVEKYVNDYIEPFKYYPEYISVATIFNGYRTLQTIPRLDISSNYI